MSGDPLSTRQDLRRSYQLPVTPPVAWSNQPSKRRARLGWLALAGVLVVQTLLTVRLDNTPFQDEALYLYASRLLGDSEAMGYFSTYFSGAPYVYPVLVAPFEQALGLEGARLFSLLLMLGVTALIYSFTKRLFGMGASLLAAACYSVVASTAFLGNLATYDALGVFLLACAVWSVVRFADRAVLAVALATPLCVLAFASKYATGIFLPSVVAVASVVAIQHGGMRRALTRGLALAVLIGLGIGAFFMVGGVAEGIGFTTTGREAGTDGALEVLQVAAQHSGLYLLIALFGSFMFWWKGNPPETPGEPDHSPDRPIRLLFGLVMVGSGLLVPLYQANLHTLVALPKHVGYGMMFAAPMVGLGMSRLLGRHLHNPQFPIAAWVGLFFLGYFQALTSFHGWPHSDDLIRLLKTEVTPQGRYLSTVPQVAIYSLGPDLTSRKQWISTYGFSDYEAVKKGKFDLIVLDEAITPDVNAGVERGIADGGHYRLRAKLVYDPHATQGYYRIWSKSE